MEKDKKAGVDFVFKQNPELANIGTEQDYSEYLNNILPESKVKNIVYHQTPRKFEEFDVNKSRTGGIYFSPFNRRAGILRNHTKAALLSIKNPFIISKKQNKKFERYLPNINKLHRKVDLKEYDGVIGFSNVFYDKGQLDKDIFNIDSSIKNNIEFVTFKPEQIHILGSQQDIEKFKEYIKHKDSGKSKQGDSTLEGKVVSVVFLLSFLASLFFLSPNLTGNSIGTLSKGSSSFLGGILFLLGISGFFITKKLIS
jgi:hypothetical protein